MNAAEEVTMQWLILQGYFIMRGVKYGRHEIDLLGVKLGKDRQSLEDRVHVEVSVSSRPRATSDPEEGYRTAAQSFVGRKFESVRPKVEELLGSHYSRWRVTGKLGGGEREERIQMARCEELCVRVIPFKKVVTEMANLLAAAGSRPADNMGQLFHILSSLQLLNTSAEK